MKIYSSCLAPLIESFIQEKQSSGYQYKTGASLMHQFDDYWLSHQYSNTILTAANVADWMQLRDGESSGGYINRISVVREFSCYMNGLGIRSYIPPIEVDKKTPLVHIFAKAEISDLFSQIDAYHPKSTNPDILRMAEEYPVLFRLIYLNGMRISEACKLPVSNVDFDEGIITLLDGKGNRDRIIYLADDMRILCKEYFDFLCRILGEKPQWLFPGINPINPVNIITVEIRFNDCWSNTTYANGCPIKPTVHCLRHTFVVNRINLWIRQGLEFEQMLPYLSKYLGHKSFNETYYYYHYVEESAMAILTKDKTIGKVIPEVMRR